MASQMPRRPEPEPMDLPDEARAYAAADFADVNAAFVERLMAVAGHLDAASAVDLGTGPGDIPVRVARERPGWRITAVDNAPAMIQIARRRVETEGLAGHIEVVLSDAKGRDPRRGAFDVIFSNSILHHITDTAAYWERVRAMGRPGAIVFLRDLFCPRTPAEGREIVARYAGDESELLREEFHRSLLSAYTPAEVRGQLRDAGLECLSVETVTDRHVDIWGQLPPA